MAVRLITYDLKKEPSKHDYSGFYKVIKSYSWVRLSESSYAIDTNTSPTDIFNLLKPHIDDNDWVLVMTLTRPYWGQHHKDVIAWLDQRLP